MLKCVVTITTIALSATASGQADPTQKERAPVEKSAPKSAIVPPDADAPQGTVTLAEDGHSKAVLVLPDKPTVSAQVGALELQSHLEAITGAEFSILSETDAATVEPDTVRINIGPTAAALAAGYADFQPQEFVIDIRPGEIFLLGADEADYGKVGWDEKGRHPIVPKALKKNLLFTKLGTMYAVHEFLYRNLGVRWFMPVAPGIVIPKAPTIRIKAGVFRLRPWTEYRFISGTNLWDPWCFPGSGKERKLIDHDLTLWWLLRNKVGGKPFAVNHSFYGYFARFGKTHPEWWGSNQPSRTAHLEYSDPGLRAQVVKDACAFFDGKLASSHGSAQGEYFGVVPNDSSTGWSVTKYSEELQKAEVPVPAEFVSKAGGVYSFWNGKRSRYIWDLVNHVAREVRKTHPEAHIAALAYARYTLRPPEFKLEPNVAVCVTRAAVISPRPNDQRYFRYILNDWATQTDDLYVWEYYCYQMFASKEERFQKFPCLTPSLIGEQLRWLRGKKINGYFYELAQMIPSKGMPNLVEQMIPIYLTQRLLVDPNADGQALLEDFCQSMFGPAAVPMQEFVEDLEKQFVDPAHWKSATMDTKIQWWRQMADPEKARAWRKLFTHAYALAETDKQKTRIRLFDEALLRQIERHTANFAMRLQAGHRLLLNPDGTKEIAVGDSSHAAITWVEDSLDIHFSDLPEGWQAVQIALDPARRRGKVLSAKISRDGTREISEGLEVTQTKIESNAVTFRVRLPAGANADADTLPVWGGDFYVWQDDTFSSWSHSVKPPLDPNGFGVIRFQ